MTAVSRLGRQIAEVTAMLRGTGARFALIGGLALASHNVVRATQDIDLLVDAEMADRIDAELVKLQGLINDPRRTQDREDIRALLKANRAKLDMTEVREYFELFNRLDLLDALLREID